MAWCPKCKSEYIKGITFCKDCNEQLIDSLEDYDKAQDMQQQNYEDQNLTEDDFNEGIEPSEFSDEEKFFSKKSHVYVKKEDKYKDMLSSAYTLLIVGFGGLIILLLVMTDIINLHLASPGKYITYSGIGILLVIFVIVGIHSLNASKKLAKEADSENQLTNDILAWFNKNITEELIDNGVSDEMVDEMVYFKRIENIREIISKAYGDLNEDYLDKLSEDIYQEKF